MDAELYTINQSSVLALHGPMRLNISAWSSQGPDNTLAAQAGRFAFSLLPRLVPAMRCFTIQDGSFEHLRDEYEDPLLARMVRAARRMNTKVLGPMAAVAGLVAEEVALWLRAAGASKAIVENNGDLAIYLKPGQTASVGVRLGVCAPHPAYALELCGNKHSLWGVASSGFGGRGLTQGIADAAMCVAQLPAEADAAATAVAAACQIASPAVAMALAATEHPNTDIAELLVTKAVGFLSKAEITAALGKAGNYAQTLVERDVLLGAFISLRGHAVLTQGFEQAVATLKPLASPQKQADSFAPARLRA